MINSKSIKQSSKAGLVSLLLLIFDLGGIYISFYMASFFRQFITPWFGGIVYWPVYLPVVYVGMLFTVILFAFNGLYPGYGLTAVIEIKQLAKALTLVYGFLGILVYFSKANTDFPRSIFLFAWFISLGIIPILRIIIRNRVSLFRWYGTPVFVIANDEQDISIIETLQRCRRMGWNPTAVLLLNPQESNQEILKVPQLKSVDQLYNKSANDSVKRVIVGTQFLALEEEERHKLIRDLNTRFESIVLVSPAYELGSIWIEPRDLEGQLGLELHYHLLRTETLFVKRLTDILGASALLLVTSPLLLFVALLIKVSSPGPIFYSHRRKGKDSKDFQMLKFRSMIVDADQRLTALLEQNPQARKEWEDKQKLTDDPRLTGIGKWIRKFSIDELPQLLNVFRGEMSLIGPRPVTDGEIEKYGDYGSLILRVKPGITGWWQIMGRNQTTWDQRTKLEVYYVSNWSLWMDAYITIKTIWVIISGQGR